MPFDGRPVHRAQLGFPVHHVVRELLSAQICPGIEEGEVEPSVVFKLSRFIQSVSCHLSTDQVPGAMRRASQPLAV